MINHTFLFNKIIYFSENRDEFIRFIINSKNKILISLNAELLSIKNEKFEKIVNSNIGFPDGIGAVFALRKKSFKAIRITGVELWLDIIKENYLSKSFFLIGSTQEVIEKTVLKLNKEFPGIQIVGFHNGYFDSNEKAKIFEEIISKKPNFVFVALGAPKQEFLMNELIATHPALYMGLGGSFDVYCGKVQRAPRIFQVFGLEWLYRLAKQPTRINRQIVYIKFMLRLILNRI